MTAAVSSANGLCATPQLVNGGKWIAQTTSVSIEASKTVTVNFALHAVGC
jgi:hypothetical protein